MQKGNRARWLFAVTLSMERPLDADASACVRSLLRWFHQARAALVSRLDPDDPSVIANTSVFIVILGRYFSQEELR